MGAYTNAICDLIETTPKGRAMLAMLEMIGDLDATPWPEVLATVRRTVPDAHEHDIGLAADIVESRQRPLDGYSLTSAKAELISTSQRFQHLCAWYERWLPEWPELGRLERGHLRNLLREIADNASSLEATLDPELVEPKVSDPRGAAPGNLDLDFSVPF